MRHCSVDIPSDEARDVPQHAGSQWIQIKDLSQRTRGQRLGADADRCTEPVATLSAAHGQNGDWDRGRINPREIR